MQAVTVTAEGGEGGFWATAAPIIPHPLEFFFGLACFAILYFIVKPRRSCRASSRSTPSAPLPSRAG